MSEPRNPRTVYCSQCNESKHLSQQWYCTTHRTIADAAPEMYEALKSLVAVCEREDWDEPDDDLNTARAAIAKAEGRQP